MEIINRKARMSSLARKLRRENKSVGLVPTMGALHAGHLSLVEEARKMCDIVIVSVFVNPTQFGKGEDFEKYPRDLTKDAAMLADYNIDYIFAPDTTEIYPEGFSTHVDVEGLSEQFEGEFRPGHFRGVATVVTILFNTIRPDYAFFGQKDAQQCAVIRRMAKDLGYDTEIVVLPIVREENGLAMSSRNEYLSPEGREKAAIIYKGLCAAKQAAKAGERNAANLAQKVRETIETEPLAKIDYVAVVDNETLQPIEKIGDGEVLIATTVRFGAVRLLDNTIINRKH